VAVVDYGMGNLRSVYQALKVAAFNSKFDIIVTSNPDEVMASDRVVLPGQGAMPDCMRELKKSGLIASVMESIASKPIFGVCVGMQMMLEKSAEGSSVCLSIFPGEVCKFDLKLRIQPDGSRFKVPQMGWNQVQQIQVDQKKHPLWQGIPDHSFFYFVHSFYAKPSDSRHTVGKTDYGNYFSSALARDNIFATQFHPEKSAQQGLMLYRNFLDWNP